jgi:hypothetical protein
MPDWRCTLQGPADCWFVAAAAALAHRRPAQIVKMITAHADGTYTVQLPAVMKAPLDLGGVGYLVRQPSSITIAAPVPSEGYSTASDGSTWLGILEKAYAEWLHRDRGSAPGTARDRIHGTHPLCEGISVLTGHRADGDWIWPAWLTRKSTTRAKLQEAFRHNRIVTAATWFFGAKKSRLQIAAAGLACRHVYTVIDYDAASDTLQLRNPWGLLANEGSISIVSLEDFYRYFVEVGYELGS